MPLFPCEHCGAARRTATECPHCRRLSTSGAAVRVASIALLGLGLTACDGDDDISVEPEYGVAVIDEDGDGWGVEEGDCDDADPAVYPGAEDTPDDGVDSDCDGED